MALYELHAGLGVHVGFATNVIVRGMEGRVVPLLLHVLFRLLNEFWALAIRVATYGQ